MPLFVFLFVGCLFHACVLLESVPTSMGLYVCGHVLCMLFLVAVVIFSLFVCVCARMRMCEINLADFCIPLQIFLVVFCLFLDMFCMRACVCMYAFCIACFSLFRFECLALYLCLLDCLFVCMYGFVSVCVFGCVAVQSGFVCVLFFNDLFLCFSVSVCLCVACLFMHLCFIDIYLYSCVMLCLCVCDLFLLVFVFSLSF